MRHSKWLNPNTCVRDGTQTTWSFFSFVFANIWPFLIPHRGFTWFFEDPPPLPQTTTWHIWKKSVFTGRLFTSQRSIGYHYYLLYFMKGPAYNVYQYESRTGKEKVIVNEVKWRRRPEKDAHLKTPSLMCWSHHGFSQKNRKNNHLVF